MTEINSMVPATGCLLAGGVQIYPTRAAEFITQHYPVYGLRADLTLVIELNGHPATTADLDAWLIEIGDKGQFYSDVYGSGLTMWTWLPACECRGTTLKREPWGDAASAPDDWARWKTEREEAASAHAAGAR